MEMNAATSNATATITYHLSGRRNEENDKSIQRSSSWGWCGVAGWEGGSKHKASGYDAFRSISLVCIWEQ